MRRALQKLALYAFHIFFARPILKWVVGARFRRRHVVPNGPCLVVSNHNSHLDAALLMTLFPLRRLAHVHPVAAADYFGSSWFMRMMAMLFMNGIPIERRPVRGQDPLNPIIEQLKAGESLVFFPEGSRGEAGVVARFRPGVGLLVRGVPGLLVVPVFLSGPERIWPRGNLVPVPLSINVHVGRPRSYSSTEDPRVIADKVREDVLALAPPRPPLPGDRPAPPVRIELCGIDDERRSEIFRVLVARLGASGPTVGLGEPVIESDAEGVREVTGPIPVGWGRIPWLRPLAWIFRAGDRFRGDRFVEMIERAWANEALGQGRDTRFVVVDGSGVADLMAWTVADASRGGLDESALNRLTQYLAGEKRVTAGRLWRLFREAREAWLVHVFSLARLPTPEILVHLTSPVPRVMQRVRSRGAELQSFENEPFLERLQEAYRRVGGVLQKRRKVEVLEMDDSGLRPEELVGRVETACRRLIETSRTGS